MPKTMYVLARTTTGRPAAQHEVNGRDTRTVCGVEMAGWSRYYTTSKLGIIFCMRCARCKGGRSESC